MLPVKPVIIVFATALLTACASSGPAPSFEDSFATDISADGTKFFTYTRRLHKDAKTQGHHHPQDTNPSAGLFPAFPIFFRNCNILHRLSNVFEVVLKPSIGYKVKAGRGV